ncbi:MAG: hypothetical protein H6835_13545 [Planctomycetes bacterium]|nr:hypothetical protein [Planctomycetota bacterium]
MNRLFSGRSLVAASARVVAFAGCVSFVSAQCALDVVPSGHVPGIDGTVLCAVDWDPDGAGPLPARQVFGGSFTTAGDELCDNLVAFDPSTATFADVGGGVHVPWSNALAVRAMAVLPNGDLVVGGNFMDAGGLPVGNIARFDGVQWHELGNGLGGACHALAVLPGGDLIAGGTFLIADGVSAAHIARWDGSAWHALGGGTDFHVYALASMGNGGVAVGGGFSQAGGQTAWGVALWHPVSGWQAIGDIDGGVLGLCVTPGGGLAACGGFLHAGGIVCNSIAHWDGVAWHAMGSGVNNLVSAVATLPNGDVVIGGQFSVAGGVSCEHLARWDGTAWQAMGNGTDGNVHALRVAPGGELLVGGAFHEVDGRGVESVVRWTPAGFEALGAGPYGCNGTVLDAIELGSGDVVCVGAFTWVGDVEARHVARWDGLQWHALGTGLNGDASKVVELPNGDLVVAGTFSAAGGVPAPRLARWDGVSWSAFGTPLDGVVGHLAVLPGGDVVAFGGFSLRLARWDGATWQSIPNAPYFVNTSTVPQAMAVGPDGLLYLSSIVWGGFRAARWDGATWTDLPGLTSAATSFAFDDGGGIYVTGGGKPVQYWNGSSWSVVGPAGFTNNGGTTSLTILPDGDLLVGGSFTSLYGVPMQNLGRWDGTAWQPLLDGANGQVNRLRTLRDDRVLVAGAMSAIDGVLVSRLGWLESSCPADVADLGGGCGGVQLTAARPWLGGSWASTADGIAPGALVVQAYGASMTPFDLGSVLPAQPGCELLVSPVLFGLAVADAAGVATASLTLPSDVALVGVHFDHQMVPVALDPLGAIADVTVSNSVQVTLGWF